jgi:hypothetical protein
MMHRDRLNEIRRALLDLHKGLIDRARVEYEKAHGAVSPGELLQLLIRDDEFSWLHPISAMIVRVDELISNSAERRRPNPARPALTDDQARAESEALLLELRELLTSDHAPEGFRARYDAALQRDAAIALMHQAVMEALPLRP